MNDADINEIKRACRAGIVVPALLFLFALLVVTALLIDSGLSVSLSVIFSFLATLISFALVSFIINRKYYLDIRDKEKDEVISYIQEKQKKKDFEAGSGSLGKPMNEFIRYDIIVNNVIYKVDEKFFNECAEGDRIIIYFARHSRYLLGFVLKRKNIYN